VTVAAKKHTDVVLDAHALLAYLQAEPGAERVRELLHQAEGGTVVLWLSLINLGEVLYTVEREQSLQAAQKVVALVDNLPIRQVAAERALTFAAAHLRAQFRISYADAFAAALAQSKNAALITGDPEFRALTAVVEILWLPRD